MIVDFHSFKLKETAAEQSTKEPSASVTLIARISTVVVFNYWMTSLCIELLVAPESSKSINTVSKAPRATNERQDLRGWDHIWTMASQWQFVSKLKFATNEVD